jgi:tRNA pseudouridine13 synthase
MIDPLVPPPLLTASLPGIDGRIKAVPEDFEVEEVPAYLPSGAGDHLYLWVEKRDMGAEYFLHQVARRLGIDTGAVGTAGLKDRHAITRQWVSVPSPCESQLSALEGEGIRVLKVSRHSNKLKTGHLHGNRFRILIRDPDPQASTRLTPLVERLRQGGLPNFYGQQRFGRGGETGRAGLALLAKEAPPPSSSGQRLNWRKPFLRKLALSAGQALLFNAYLSQRLHDGLLNRVLCGDVMSHWPRGGLFVAEDPSAEQQRFDARAIVPTGPMFGRKMFPAQGEAAHREAAILEEAGLLPEAFQGFGKLLSGTRRHNVIFLEDLTAEVEAEGVRIQVTLPAGSYATILLRELMHTEIPDDPASE